MTYVTVPIPQHVAFAGDEILVAGDLLTVAMAVRDAAGKSPRAVLVFKETTGEQIDIDTRGTDAELAERLTPNPSKPSAGTPSPVRGRGRPKLGVIGREVTLLPRHWQWLETQRGGASASLRRLIDEARKTHRSGDQVRQAQARTHRFISAMAGSLPGFEEACRALFAADHTQFLAQTRTWPTDIHAYAHHLAARVFTA